MTLVLNEPSDALTCLSVVNSLEGLHKISKPDCAGVLWMREPLASFQNWIDTLDPEDLPTARLVLRPEAVHAAIAALCVAAKTPHGPEQERLIDDIAALSVVFAEVMKTDFLRLRLAKVSGNACRKFHKDAMTARLICTYRGSGTQYGVSNHQGELVDVFSAPTGSPIILHGNVWPPRPDTCLLHRSPPIEGSNETRLVLVLDAVTQDDSE